jgi:signal transduction histidine kinase
MTPERVLIVDDDSALLTALTGAMRLRMPNVAVDACDSGPAALERIALTDYDAIVTDIKMPGMDGLALLERIRAVRADLPTLLITGHGQHDLAVQALRGGAFDLIQKPIDRDYFVASLTRAIRMRQMSRQLQQQQATLERHAAELEQTVQARTRQLRESNRRKDEFLAVLSHELRNPLACILSSIELISLTSGNGAPLGENCRVIAREARQMNRLLDDLLDLSRINRNRIELRKTRLPFSRIVDDAVSATRSAIAAREHRLEVQLDASAAEACVYADATRLQQVVVNLLNNAAKYTPAGGRVSLEAAREGAEIVLHVADDGVGISDQLLPRVFEPFVQADDSRHRAEGGLGIGLTLVRQLVQLHDGSVTASSPGLGRGSRFSVRLPIVVEGVAEDESTIIRRALPLAPRRVLVVEDRASLAMVTRLLLEEHGQHVVAVAADGPSAIEAALEHRPDMVLLDIGLPGMSGYEVARRLRGYPQLDHAVLVAMTGYGRPDDRRRADEAGIRFHLVKPFTFESLANVLELSQPSEQLQGAPAR